MYKELVIIIIIIVLVIAGNIITQNNTNKTVETMNEDGKIKAEKYPEITETIPDNKLQ